MRSGSDSTNGRTKPFQQVRVRVDFPAAGGAKRATSGRPRSPEDRGQNCDLRAGGEKPKPFHILWNLWNNKFEGFDRTLLSENSCRIALLTAGRDKPYALPLASSLISQGVAIDFIGSDLLDASWLRESPQVRFLNFHGDMRSDVSAVRKVLRILSYYGRLIRYATTAAPKVFHVLWNSKCDMLDRTLLMLYYRLLGKRIALTVHNVNARWRDGNDSLLNRLTLRMQYRLCDHLFVHTEQMKRELRTHFGVPGQKISVIPFGINNTVPNTGLTSIEARQRLGLTGSQKVILFFGLIRPYKGLEYLVEAMGLLARTEPDYRLIIAGNPHSASYWDAIQRRISAAGIRPKLIERAEFVPDADTEIYFKAADVVVLPYTHIFQSGVVLLAYNFGLPIVASDVGSLKEDIIVGRTGFLFQPLDAVSLVKCIETYFSSELYRELDTRRQDIKDFAAKKYSWTTVSEITQSVYKKLLAQR